MATEGGLFARGAAFAFLVAVVFVEDHDDAGMDDRGDEADVVGGLSRPSAVVVLGGPRRRRLRQYVPTNLYSRGCLAGLSALALSAMVVRDECDRELNNKDGLSPGD